MVRCGVTCQRHQGRCSPGHICSTGNWGPGIGTLGRSRQSRLESTRRWPGLGHRTAAQAPHVSVCSRPDKAKVGTEALTHAASCMASSAAATCLTRRWHSSFPSSTMHTARSRAPHVKTGGQCNCGSRISDNPDFTVPGESGGEDWYLAAGAGRVGALVALVGAAAKAVAAPVATSIPPPRPEVYPLGAVPARHTHIFGGA